MSKTLVGVNTLTSVDQYVYSNHCQFWYRLGKVCPDDKFIFYTPARMTIDRMRNSAAKIALEQECDYLMFIDDDVIIPHTSYNDLKEGITVGYDVIAGVTVVRGYPYNFMVFKEDNKGGLRFYNDLYDINNNNSNNGNNKYIDCDAVGFSLVLIKCETLKKLQPPFFVTGSKHTEDIFFCMKLKHYLKEIRIGVIPHLKTAHMGERRAYHPDNREYYKILDESESPFLKDIVEYKERDGDRGEDYLKKCNIES